jgi:hypothetical protein
VKMANLDRIKRMLADDLKTLRDGEAVVGVEEMADAIEMVGPEYSSNAREIRAAQHDAARLATEYAIVLMKLERPT